MIRKATNVLYPFGSVLSLSIVCKTLGYRKAFWMQEKHPPSKGDF